MNGLSRLLQQVAREQDALRAQSRDRAQVRAQLGSLEVAPRVTRAPGRIRAAIVFSAAAALAMAATVVLRARVPEPAAPLALTAGAANAPVPVGAWIEADARAPMPLRFSDGTRVQLSPRGRARVVAIDSAGAHLLLESGHARVEVVPRKKSSWRLSVGPFAVRVTGTRFDVRWDPEADVFGLDLEHGRVEVSGCMFGQRYAITQGQAVEASCKLGRLHVGKRDQAAAQPAAAAAPEARAAEAPQPAANPVAAPAVGERRPGTSGRSAGSPRWRVLAAQGKFAAAFAVADAVGYEAECARADAQELAMLADAARYARRPEHEAHALRLLRQRFAGSGRAALAAFALGRLEFDRHHAYEEAAEWFGTYLREQPDGPLTREARGRVMEATLRSGDGPRARELARGYLRDYPSGPHAELARSLRAGRP